MKQIPTTIWFAAGSFAKGLLKLWPIDANGILLAEPGKISFDGWQHRIRIQNVQTIRVRSKLPPLPLHIGVAVFFYVMWVAARWDPLFAAGVSFGLLLIVMIANAFVPWVEVGFQDKHGIPRTAWFHRPFGWWQGHHVLCDQLKSVVLSDPKANVEPILFAKKLEPVTRVCSECGDYVIPTEENRCPDCDQPL